MRGCPYYDDKCLLADTRGFTGAFYPQKALGSPNGEFWTMNKTIITDDQNGSTGDGSIAEEGEELESFTVPNTQARYMAVRMPDKRTIGILSTEDNIKTLRELPSSANDKYISSLKLLSADVPANQRY